MATATLHVENSVRDYDAWKDSFDSSTGRGARRDAGTSYRIVRSVEDSNRVMVDLEFDSTTRAEQFREFLLGVLRTPQAQSHLVEHRDPVVLEVAEQQHWRPEPAQAGWVASRPPGESSAVSGRAMLSSDSPSALTPRKASMMPPAIISAAPMK